MYELDRPARRRYLAGLVGLATAGLAGCGEASGTRGRARARDIAPGRPTCADGFAVTELDARVRRGSLPEVDLRLRNDGDEPVTYEVRVQFRQRTSTGLEALNGRDSLVGTLAPGETVERTATTDGPGAENATSYRLEASLSCAPA